MDRGASRLPQLGVLKVGLTGATKHSIERKTVHTENQHEVELVQVRGKSIPLELL